MYHPHADEMVQLAVGMMGLFIIHPKAGEAPIDRDYCFLLHNWALHPGHLPPGPVDDDRVRSLDLQSKVFPAIEPLVARTGERVRIRVGNLSMHESPGPYARRAVPRHRRRRRALATRIAGAPR
jgi:FtsP/CotA-like multicopper oxidase with cupredoxin domain